jgi:uncharacterized protein
MSDVFPNKDYARFLAEGRFMIQRSPSGAYVFYPRVAEPGTGDELEWVEASGHGVVYATTVIYPKPPLEKYNVSLIELEEGPRMMSRVQDVPPTEVKIGMKVKARIIDEKNTPLVVFSPA